MAVTNALLNTAIAAIDEGAIRADMASRIGALGGSFQDNKALSINLGNAPGAAIKHAAMIGHLKSVFGVRSLIGPLKAVVHTWSEEDCQKEVAALHKSWKEGEEALSQSKSAGFLGAVVLSSSFYRYANQGEQNAGRAGMIEGQKMLLKALLAVKRVPFDKEHADRYADWFGPYSKNDGASRTRHAKVVKNFTILYTALVTKPCRIYFRAKKIGNSAIEDLPEPHGKANVCTAIAQCFPKDQWKSDPNYTKSAFTHVEVGVGGFGRKGAAKAASGAVIDRGRLRTMAGKFGSLSKAALKPAPGNLILQAGTGSFDTVGGTIIHELSHYLCDTSDNDNTYGPDKCKALAIGDPEKAANNADNYEYFCETF